MSAELERDVERVRRASSRLIGWTRMRRPSGPGSHYETGYFAFDVVERTLYRIDGATPEVTGQYGSADEAQESLEADGWVLSLEDLEPDFPAMLSMNDRLEARTGPVGRSLPLRPEEEQIPAPPGETTTAP